MKLNINKKDIEQLLENKKYDELIKILNIVVGDEETIKTILGFIGKYDDYLVKTVCEQIRSYNIDQSLDNFIPYKPKNKFINRFVKGNLTKEEKNYIKNFKKSIKNFRNAWEGNVDEETYEALRQLYEIDKDEYYIGIHRSAIPVDETFENGIRCRFNDISDHVQRMDNFDFMLSQISACESYKFSTGCFIIKVPKSAVDEASTPIFYEKNGDKYLDPKYVVGYVPVQNKKLAFFEFNDQIKEVNADIYNNSGKKIGKQL